MCAGAAFRYVGIVGVVVIRERVLFTRGKQSQPSFTRCGPWFHAFLPNAKEAKITRQEQRSRLPAQFCTNFCSADTTTLGCNITHVHKRELIVYGTWAPRLIKPLQKVPRSDKITAARLTVDVVDSYLRHFVTTHHLPQHSLLPFQHCTHGNLLTRKPVVLTRGGCSTTRTDLGIKLLRFYCRRRLPQSLPPVL